MKKLKNFFKKIQANSRPLLQIIILFVLLGLPVYFNATFFLQQYFKKNELDFDNLKYYFLMQFGNWAIGIALASFVLITLIRVSNKEKVFNIKNVYHQYPYLWYWFCAKILGYKKCNLKLVPIYLQFKLVLNDTFDEYYVGEDDEYPEKENELIEIKKVNFVNISNEVNLVFADTYPIKMNQLPDNKKQLSTVFVSRENSKDCNRYFSQMFIKDIIITVRGLPINVKNVNIFATTNPKHTLNIVKRAFNIADRGNIDILKIFQQDRSGERIFRKEGIIIYKR